MSPSSQQEATQAVKLMAKVGIVAYGVVHLVLAWLAVQIAFGGSGEQASSKGALRQIARQPFGEVLLWVIVVGLAALVVWQVVQAVGGNAWRDDSERTRARIRHLARAVVYSALAVAAFGVVTGSGGSGGGQEETVTATLLGAPAGRVLVAAVGLGIIAVGVRLVLTGVKGEFSDRLVNPSELVETLGQVGHVAKGVTLGIVGALFGWAALTSDPDKAGGMDQALATLRGQPFGQWLLVAKVGS